MEWIINLLTNTAKWIANFSSPEIKWVDTEYANKCGIIDKYKKKGYKLQWNSERDLQRKIDLEGWEYVYLEKKFWQKKTILKIKDRICDQTLIAKKEDVNR